MRARHQLPVPVIGQPTGYACGNTCLAAVAQYLGKHVTPTEMAKLANTRREGTDHGDMIAAARATGATVFAKSDGTLDELAWFITRGLPVIIGWWSMEPGDRDFDPAWTLAQRRRHDCGHYSVVCGVTEDAFVLMDPQDGDDGTTIGICEKRDADLERVWYDTDTPAFDKVRRWYMTLNYEGRRFADVIAGGRDVVAP